MEHEANLLWINSDSSYNFHEAWLRENFRKNERSQLITVRSENVLAPAVINKVTPRGLFPINISFSFKTGGGFVIGGVVCHVST